MSMRYDKINTRKKVTSLPSDRTGEWINFTYQDPKTGKETHHKGVIVAKQGGHLIVLVGKVRYKMIFMGESYHSTTKA